DALLGIPIGPKRQMASRDYELELAAAGSAENGNTLIGPPRTPPCIILELFEKAAVPIGIHNSLEYLVNQRLLRRRKKIAADGPTSDLPMVGYEGAQDPEGRIMVIPIKANLFPLILGYAGV